MAYARRRFASPLSVRRGPEATHRWDSAIAIPVLRRSVLTFAVCSHMEEVVITLRLISSHRQSELNPLFPPRRCRPACRKARLSSTTCTVNLADLAPLFTCRGKWKLLSVFHIDVGTSEVLVDKSIVESCSLESITPSRPTSDRFRPHGASSEGANELGREPDSGSTRASLYRSGGGSCVGVPQTINARLLPCYVMAEN